MSIEGKIEERRPYSRDEESSYSIRIKRRTLLDDGDVLLGGDHLEKQIYVRFGEPMEDSRQEIGSTAKKTYLDGYSGCG